MMSYLLLTSAARDSESTAAPTDLPIEVKRASGHRACQALRIVPRCGVMPSVTGAGESSESKTLVALTHDVARRACAQYNAGTGGEGGG